MHINQFLSAQQRIKYYDVRRIRERLRAHELIKRKQAETAEWLKEYEDQHGPQKK